jgi:hypothetical protein
MEDAPGVFVRGVERQVLDFVCVEVLDFNAALGEGSCDHP